MRPQRRLDGERHLRRREAQQRPVADRLHRDGQRRRTRQRGSPPARPAPGRSRPSAGGRRAAPPPTAASQHQRCARQRRQHHRQQQQAAAENQLVGRMPAGPAVGMAQPLNQQHAPSAPCSLIAAPALGARLAAPQAEVIAEEAGPQRRLQGEQQAGDLAAGRLPHRGEPRPVVGCDLQDGRLRLVVGAVEGGLFGEGDDSGRTATAAAAASRTRLRPTISGHPWRTGRGRGRRTGCRCSAG